MSIYLSFMKAFLPALWLSVCLLGTAFVAPVQAASSQDKPAAGAAHATKAAPAKKAPASKAKPSASASKSKPAAKKAPAKPKSKWAYQDIKTPLPSAKVDLSLPPEMVKHLQPVGSVPLPKREPLLPQMFGEKPKESSPFQLNGRLLSNEMQLQLRNEERRDIEGAALDFEFKQ
ncbi:hypothetical protein PPC_1873 [Pseudomonas protegens Cab57]|nr:hypothetical protein PPC_1873 [Pseudomonas protegens Cab57]